MLKKMHLKCNPTKLKMDTYDYTTWFIKEEESADISSMSILEGDKENVKEGKRLEILFPNKPLITAPVLLTWVKAGNNSYKLKIKVRQILYLLYQQNKITKKMLLIT